MSGDVTSGYGGFSRRLREFLPASEWILFSVLLLLASTSTVANMLADCDTGVHVRAGEWMLSHWAIPTNDLWSSASPRLPWLLHEWLSQVIFGFVHMHLGLAGVVILCSTVIALTYALLYRWILEHENHPAISFSLIVLVLAASKIHWLARPHVFSLLLLVVWYRQLDLYGKRGETWRLIVLPPMMLLWVNLHGGFVSGLILLGMYLFSEMLKTGKNTSAGEAVGSMRRSEALGIALAACVAAACVNPYGPRILLFPLELQGNADFMQGVMEFKSPDFHAKLFLVFEFFLLFAVGVLSMSSRPLPVLSVMLLLFHLDMALYSARHITLFCIVAAPILAGALRGIASLPRYVSMSPPAAWKNASLCAVAIALAIALVGLGVGVPTRFNEYAKPVDAVRFLERVSPAGPMFNNDEFGDYMIYAHAPFQVFIDGRADIYVKGRFSDSMKVTDLRPGWEELLVKHGIQWVFIRSDTLLSWALWKKPGEWALVYSDGVADVFVRLDGPNRGLAEAHAGTQPRKPRKDDEVPKTFWGKIWKSLL